MYKIVVSDQCGCFRRSDMQNNIIYDSKDDALVKAIEMRDTMNEEFCKKHEFELQEVYNNFVISFYTGEKRECCGNGCCS